MKHFVLPCSKPFHLYHLICEADSKFRAHVQAAYDSVVYLDKHTRSFVAVEIYCDLKAFVAPGKQIKAGWISEEEYALLLKKHAGDNSVKIENPHLFVSMNYAKIKGVCSAGGKAPAWLVTTDLSQLDGIAKPPNRRS